MNRVQREKQANIYYINEPGIIFSRIVQGCVRLGFKVGLNLHSKKDRNIDKLEGPIVLLGNHVSAIDPFVMGSFVTKKWVHYITAQSYFETPVFKSILDYIGAIPKRQGMVDLRTTRISLGVLKRGGAVGLFPEGSRTIDGSMLPFGNSSAKLIKQTGSNVVISHQNGASICLPRWYRGCSNGYRAGRIDHSAFVLANKDQVKLMDIEELDAKIRAALYYNEYEWQRKSMVKFLSRTMAEGMHAILHKCPKCGYDFSMATKKDHLYCKKCGNTAIVDRYGLIHARTDDDVAFPDMTAWRKWQNEHLYSETAKDDYRIAFKGVLEIKDSFGKILETYKDAEMSVDRKNVTYRYDADKQTLLPLKSIDDAVSDYSLCCEINRECNSYQFTPVDGQVVVKITDSIKCLNGVLS